MVSSVISAEICVLTRRAAELAEARLAQAGKGPPPVGYAVLVLGSAGRGESLLAADQDNAIVYERGEPGGPPRTSGSRRSAIEIASMLDAAGVPFCKGGVMARNAQWRMSVARWKTTIDGWVRRQRPQDLLNVDIFFDGVPVHGTLALGEAIWNYAYDAGRQSPAFVKLLSELARDWRAPLTLFGNIRSDIKGRTDLKKGGLLPLVTAARALSIRHDVRARSTVERFQGVAAAGVGSPQDTESIIEAHRVAARRRPAPAAGRCRGRRPALARRRRRSGSARRSGRSCAPRWAPCAPPSIWWAKADSSARRGTLRPHGPALVFPAACGSTLAPMGITERS